MKIEAKVVKVDEELFYRLNRIRFGSDSFLTPQKASRFGANVTPLNEIHRKIKKESLAQMRDNVGLEQQINSRLEKQTSDGIDFCFVDYCDGVKPSEQEMRILSDIQYAASDISITPLWSGLPKYYWGNDFKDTTIELNKCYIDWVKTLNHKSIMGVVSDKMPSPYVPDVVSHLIENDCTHFAVDYRGCAMIGRGSWLRNFERTLNEYGILDETLLYAINAREGRFGQNANRILARDFMACAHGFDVLGNNYVFNVAQSYNMKKKIQMKRPGSEYRLFEGNSFGYMKVKPEYIMRRYNVTKSAIPLAKVRHNIAEQASELQNIRGNLNEDPTIMAYVSSKSCVDDSTLKGIKKLRRGVFERELRQTTLI